MAGLVFELQKDSMDSGTKVSNLLRKALVVSKKLGVIEIEAWLNNELSGYKSGDTVPPYRIIHGQVKAWNPYNGCWIPMICSDSSLVENLSKRAISLSIGELDALLEESDVGTGTLHLPFSPDIENFLIRHASLELQPTLVIGKTQLVGILNAIRNNILNWSLELEQKGILGEGMSFSNEEKKIAHQTSYNITNNIGSMQNSQLQQDSSGATQTLNVTTESGDLKALVEELKNAIENLPLLQEQTQELHEAIATLEIQAKSSNPKQVIIGESLRTARNILEGTTGSIIAPGIIYKLGMFLQ